MFTHNLGVLNISLLLSRTSGLHFTFFPHLIASIRARIWKIAIQRKLFHYYKYAISWIEPEELADIHG